MSQMRAIDAQGNARPSPVSGRRSGETGGFQPQVPPELEGSPGGVAISWAVAGAGSRGPAQLHRVQDIYPEPGHDGRASGGHGQQQPLALRGAVSAKDIRSTDETAAAKHRSLANTSIPGHEVEVPRMAGHFGGGSLTDPVFQDLDRNSRHYLAHFTDRVCQDLVARDSPSNNPFRELIPLTCRHPLLLQILIATSAIHWSNIFRPITSIPTSLTNPGDYLAQLRSRDFVSRQALIDALTAKQKAMGHLREVLDTLDPAGSEVALAAMHFFVKFDLIDIERNNGGQGWQAHLEGARGILALLAPDSSKHASSRMLRDCVIADCFIYHILGSTLADPAIASRIARYAFELLPVMKRVEVNSYLSCPPEILRIILSASQLSYERPCTDWNLSAADEALALIDEALAFDIPAWADQLRQLPNVIDVESRIHVASAHRSAVCLYILQALPLVRAVRPVDTNFLVGDILSHLAHIHDQDPYFKATSWPTFIAGAETRDAEKRTWTLTRMFAIWNICPWGYIFTAIEMLKTTWHMQDSGTASGVNWLQDLKAKGLGYLIV
ncbi:hypothetical protein ED733_004060 [Metarhizium rileyi]|uniref:Acriflavine sensitivity control protein acr-2 n=1 Tax=Metarhizium rileyi (strain RCEF 4871) TaxID=1649241 RepID=A0A5C6G6S3_METRR|nr:hypothetical protein ED733_004060 [Metarhizium rileyi]